ncbi:hypothetical protein JOF46_004017 [Paeniglutamicibacter psychrophenolicus]|uniref:Uncharacterized protein n=1 Tax=Paeniglutamicibacter psychrophenolicus TaxID=257454 RepID=A0ABS4WIT4_9MICC|nr:hypothetical protein [Paeniglutamicibacter psychrophenolicus]
MIHGHGNEKTPSFLTGGGRPRQASAAGPGIVVTTRSDIAGETVHTPGTITFWRASPVQTRA